MKTMHFVNASLWTANALTWGFYAGVAFMAFASLAAAGLSLWLWHQDA